MLENAVSLCGGGAAFGVNETFLLPLGQKTKRGARSGGSWEFSLSRPRRFETRFNAQIIASFVYKISVETKEWRVSVPRRDTKQSTSEETQREEEVRR